VGKGHGRVEVRELTGTTLLAGYLEGWADACQAFELRRVRVERGKRTEEVVHGIASLSRAEADAGRLLELVRDHWGIEGGLHYARDVTLGEDGCRARRGSAPQALAALRNVAVFLLTALAATLGAGETRAGACDHLKANPNAALQLLGLPRIKSSNSR
jgi:predicted transposase YbfD/YdcC